MKYIYALLLCSIISVAAFSQANFQKGYIIKTTGDTVKGYIDNREWNKDPEFIKFKFNQVDAQALQYKPQNIIGFAITGVSEYQSYSGYISMGNTQGTQLSSGIDTTTLNTNVFLKLLVNGENVKLLSYTDEIKPRYFIQEKGSRPVELKYNVFYSNAREERYIANTEIYKGQLLLLSNKYTAGNTKLNMLITRAEYSAAQLTVIIDTINNNKNVVVKPSGGSHLRFFAGAGIGNTKSKFTGDNEFANANSSSSTMPVFNVGLDFLPKPHSQRFILRAELQYSWANSNFETDHVASVDKYTASIKQRTFTILPQAIYNFYNAEHVKVYAGAGVGINLSSYTTTRSVTVGTYTTTYNNSFKFDPVWINVPLEAGLVINKRLDISARYFLPAEYEGGNYNIKTSSFQLGAHWLFGKKQ